MKLYITLEDNTSSTEYNICKEILNRQGSNLLGSYESRGYVTLVSDVEGSGENIIELTEEIMQSVSILEIRRTMKFYCSLDSDVRPLQVNPEVRKRLKELGYVATVYPAHTENGICYIGIEVDGLNPFDKQEMRA